MQFSKELYDDIAAGEITVSFRLWRQPHAKVGGRYRVGGIEIEVDRMELVPFADITARDVGGRARRAARRCAVVRHMPVLSERTPLRIEFHAVD
jgi:hypothetical protein